MKKKNRRPVDIVVISDVHLGTYGCRAKELLKYMKSIQPKHVILNGDIIDIWQFKKRYFPKAHIKVVKQIMNWIADGIQVDYITGNHDEMLRKFVGFKMGSFKIDNKLVMELNGEQAWIFHGDVFDVTMRYSKWLAKLGAIGYDTLIVINNLVNWFSERVLKRGRISLSKKIKNSVKSAVKFIDDFEDTAADIAISNNYEYVICGHIHQPQHRKIEKENGSVMYLNSGDWIENLSALEYNNNEWSLFKFEDHFDRNEKDEEDVAEDHSLETSLLFEQLIQEFNLMRVQ
ncbi:MAG: UDP-2,3-diacylglucosamine hydrolase [Crocinitomicaceae bacterium]|nr:UDP-2,3-diacylglucosamine hydrolase [Crocinitomicaceae bacterium]MAX82439.1 UDP-2,3-diacylglucosamine hydrolase [Crocinitomicaceae bacterium]|tara:strand:+ start:7962 stop:8825 length:864 start_codon:yes stop_codon:yes gene_type:complete